MSLFVVFEGPDGAGKSTQVRLVAERLEAQGLTVRQTREPGGTGLGERIREILLDPGGTAIAPEAEALLMTAARAQHVVDVIRPSLKSGMIVLCDRFSDSTMAYQGAGRGLCSRSLQRLQEFAVGETIPDLVVLLDLAVEAGLERRQRSGIPLNRLDLDGLAFHERVHTWYLEAARREPDRWLIVDAGKAQDDQAALICEAIVSRHRQTDEL